MAARTPTPRLARKSASYLSGDVFEPPFRNLALAEWLAIARQAGWQFRGSTSCGESVRGLCDEGQVSGVLPRTRAEVHALERRPTSQTATNPTDDAEFAFAVKEWTTKPEFLRIT